MEVSVPGNTSHYVDSSCGSLTSDPHNVIQNVSDNLALTDLKTCLTELLNIDDMRISISGSYLSPEKKCNGNMMRESDCKDLGKNVAGDWATEKRLTKCATLPLVHGPESSGDVLVGEKGKHAGDTAAEVSERNGPAKPANLCYARSASLPVPLKLISAMKGSREKQEDALPKKLSVTWVPDVYDPIPTSVSHVPTDKNHRYRYSGKKSGKYRQKGGGKSLQGGKNKNKKQAQKSSGSSSSGNSKLKQPFHMGGGVILCETQVDSLNYNVESLDQFCGSSFLKVSVANLHFSVAETT